MNDSQNTNDFSGEPTEILPITACEKKVAFWKTTALSLFVALIVYFCLSFIDMVNHNNQIKQNNDLRERVMDLKEQLDVKESKRSQLQRQNDVLISAWNKRNKGEDISNMQIPDQSNATFPDDFAEKLANRLMSKFVDDTAAATRRALISGK